MKESVIYYSVKVFGYIVRILTVRIALFIGKIIGFLAYCFDLKRKSLAYSNLKVAFSKTKSTKEIRKITKKLFINYGQNIIELLRMPLINNNVFDKIVKVDGKENIDEALKLKKGVILLAMHSGSWELASFHTSTLNHPYKVVVKPQTRHSRLDELLNEYRTCGGSVVISKGINTRDIIKSLQNNEVVGMVADQGGRDGVSVPFFDRLAPMSAGAIRLGLKWGVPILFCVIRREKGPYHRMIINKPFKLIDTGEVRADIESNLINISKIMENYIKENPSEYMWFYKIWKYSKQAKITIISDGKTGHLRQSQTVAKMVSIALKERHIDSVVEEIRVYFRNKDCAKAFTFLIRIVNPLFFQGRLSFIKWFIDEKSAKRLMAVNSDFVISCGSSVAGVNNLIASDCVAKSISVLKPGIFNFNRFDLVVLPQHDKPKDLKSTNIVITNGAPNLITQDYLENQSQLLKKRFSHLKGNMKTKIGVFIGGDSNNVFLSENLIRIVIKQLKEICNQLNVNVLISTSRRTPLNIEKIIYKEFKKDPHCPFLVIPNQEDVSEAVGGIMGISDLLIVSGDSISMMSEAACSGKNTIVFYPQTRAKVLKVYNKHKKIIKLLSAQGFIRACEVRELGNNIYDLIRNKIRTRKIDDNQEILEAVRHII